MSQTGFLKCPCRQCGGPIEFPPQGIGLTIDCPHCGQKTLLGRAGAPPPTAAPTNPQPAADADPESSVAVPVRKSPASRLLLILIAVAACAAVLWYVRRSKEPKQEAQAPTAANKLAALASSRNHPSNPPPHTAVPDVPAAPKSLDDLQASPVTLEKAKSGSLMHAVGTVRNNSDHQRFGVRVEIGLTDASGKELRKATDYAAVIEPRKEWRFRALVLDAKATAARVISINEDH